MNFVCIWKHFISKPMFRCTCCKKLNVGLLMRINRSSSSLISTGSAYLAFSLPPGTSAYHQWFSPGSCFLHSDSWFSWVYWQAFLVSYTCCWSQERVNTAGLERMPTFTGECYLLVAMPLESHQYLLYYFICVMFVIFLCGILFTL